MQNVAAKNAVLYHQHQPLDQRLEFLDEKVLVNYNSKADITKEAILRIAATSRLRETTIVSN